MLKIIETTPKNFGEKIATDCSFAAISEDILHNGTVYCIKHCLHDALIDHLRKDIFEYYSSIPPLPIDYDDAARMNGNYHSLERGVSCRQKTLHYFHAYLFNDPDHLPPLLQQRFKGLFYSLVLLYNALTFQKKGLMEMDAQGRRFRPQIFQYPCGGGMFAAHTHPLEPQKLGLILGFSKQGRDFKQGGPGFEAPDGSIIDASIVQDIGDIIVFRYDLKHWVLPCDITQVITDNQSTGRWSAVIPIY